MQLQKYDLFFIHRMGYWVSINYEATKKHGVAFISMRVDESVTCVQWSFVKKYPMKATHRNGRRIYYQHLFGPVLGWDDKNWHINEGFWDEMARRVKFKIVLTTREALQLKYLGKYFVHAATKHENKCGLQSVDASDSDESPSGLHAD
jgi:hypothetical protein